MSHNGPLSWLHEDGRTRGYITPEDVGSTTTRYGAVRPEREDALALAEVMPGQQATWVINGVKGESFVFIDKPNPDGRTVNIAPAWMVEQQGLDKLKAKPLSPAIPRTGDLARMGLVPYAHGSWEQRSYVVPTA